MAAITTLNSTDSGATSRTTINTNFININSALPNLALYALLASPTFTGVVGLPSGTILIAPVISTPSFGSTVNFGAHTAYFTETDNGNSSTADTIDWGVSNKQKSTLTGNCTFTFTAPAGPCSLLLKLVQDATGSRTVTWPATVHWSSGSAPTLTTTANKVDIITFYYDGATYFGNSSLNFIA